MTTGALAAALALIAAVNSAAPSTRVEVDPRPSLPVLGLAVEAEPDSPRGRVIDLADGRRVLFEGPLDACLERRVSLLLDRHGAGLVNARLPTLGGTQLWADVFWHAGWRIQEHAWTGHGRLLDPRDRRVAWGDLAACRAAFERERLARGLGPAGERLVVLVHGLGRTRHAFARLASELEAAGYAVADVGYPSTRASIARHAERLAGLLGELDGPREVSFVTHSLGGIVTRTALARDDPWRARIALGRVVMLAPPSRGSSVARALRGNPLFRFFAGPSGVELGGALEDLPPPPCEFGIVAGSRGAEGGWNPLLAGPDDGVVTVDETRLAGAADLLRVDATHTFLMKKEGVIAGVLAFLRTGRFDGAPAEPAAR